MTFPNGKYFQIVWKNAHVLERIRDAAVFAFTGEIRITMTGEELGLLSDEYVRRRELLK